MHLKAKPFGDLVTLVSHSQVRWRGVTQGGVIEILFFLLVDRVFYVDAKVTQIIRLLTLES